MVRRLMTVALVKSYNPMPNMSLEPIFRPKTPYVKEYHVLRQSALKHQSKYIK